MENWQDLGQAVFIGLIFSFLVAKLISTIISFRGDHLKVVREENLVSEPVDVKNLEGDARVSEDDDDDDEDNGDWEGIESTELEELFSAATAFIAATAVDRNSVVSNELQLQLYGFYMIATEGPCTKPQPSMLNVSARAKWNRLVQKYQNGSNMNLNEDGNITTKVKLIVALGAELKIFHRRNAWQRLGVIPPEEAMEKYIAIISELYPPWADASTSQRKSEGTSDSNKASKGPMGVVFSSFVHEEDSDTDVKLDAVHACAREGEAENLLLHIESGASVNFRG